jgi:hypothetical protein
MRRYLFALIAMLTATSAIAQDTHENRLAAAQRYLAAMPMSKIVDDASSEMAKQIPERMRASFTSLMKASVRPEVLEKLALESMTKIFTAEELNALADFYGSATGRKVMAKFGVYMADVTPAINRELRRAVQEIKLRRLADCLQQETRLPWETPLATDETGTQIDQCGSGSPAPPQTVLSSLAAH